MRSRQPEIKTSHESSLAIGTYTRYYHSRSRHQVAPSDSVTNVKRKLAPNVWGCLKAANELKDIHHVSSWSENCAGTAVPALSFWQVGACA